MSHFICLWLGRRGESAERLRQFREDWAERMDQRAREAWEDWPVHRDAVRHLGTNPTPRHLRFKLAFGLHVLVDLVAELIRLGGVEVDLLLEDVGEASRGHAAVVQVLHQDEGVHGGEFGCVVHGLHARYSSPEAP